FYLGSVAIRHLHSFPTRRSSDLSEADGEAIGEWVFGCDVCQEVCPWNRKAARAREPALAPGSPFPPLEALLDLDGDAFRARFRGDRKSTRLNSSHDQISYAVFCL